MDSATIDAAITGRDRGMGDALAHANSEMPSWGDDAYAFLMGFSADGGVFLTEDIRMAHRAAGNAQPPDNRAWGAVVNRAVKNGVLRREGYAPSKTGHMRPMPVWKSTLTKDS